MRVTGGRRVRRAGCHKKGSAPQDPGGAENYSANKMEGDRVAVECATWRLAWYTEACRMLRSQKGKGWVKS